MRAALAASLIGAANSESWPRNHGYRSSEPWIPRTPVVTAATGEELIADAAALPANFDWRSVNGQSFVTSDVQQHLPEYCGSCWVHGTVAAMNDRIKVMRNAAFPDIQLSRQALINCVPQPNGSYPAPGCDGGDSWQILKYMHSNQVPDETCLPYRARNEVCDKEASCQNSAAPWMVTAGWAPAAHFSVKNYYGYGVGDHGNITGEQAMKKEIYARGPISCNIACDKEFLLSYPENAAKHDGVYVTLSKFNDTDHVVEVTGWGETASGVKYWTLRNSWGTYWGDKGWFKLERGTNQQLVESDCTWGVPRYADLDTSQKNVVFGDFVKGARIMNSQNDEAQSTLAQVTHPEGNVWAFTAVAVFSSVVGGAIAIGGQKLIARRQGPLTASLLA